MTEPASTSPSQAQQSSPLREMRETQETPGAQENQPTQEPSAHQEEQTLSKPKITREEIAQHPSTNARSSPLALHFSSLSHSTV